MASLPLPASPSSTPSPAAAATYRAFGQVIESEIALPELTPCPATGAPDIRVVLSSGGALPSREDGVAARFREDGSHFLAWPEVAAFRFRTPSLIEVEPYPGTPDTYLPFPLLGPIMALALHMKGLLTLHASAIELDGRAAIFVGDKLAGKSTTAAAFLRAGARLLTDDLLAIDLSAPEAPLILPAYGQLKLAEDAARAIPLRGAEPLPLVYPAFEKRQHRLAGAFSHEGLPPERLYILQRGGEEPGITPLAGPQALAAIMRYSYITRFGKPAMPPQAEIRHLHACTALARFTRVAILHVPHDLERLDRTVALVSADRAGGR
ncbi:MAG: hypothetical protein QM690_11590 [Sphingobium sp.]